MNLKWPVITFEHNYEVSHLLDIACKNFIIQRETRIQGQTNNKHEKSNTKAIWGIQTQIAF